MWNYGLKDEAARAAMALVAVVLPCDLALFSCFGSHG
jgi:hypothetical protein